MIHLNLECSKRLTINALAAIIRNNSIDVDSIERVRNGGVETNIVHLRREPSAILVFDLSVALGEDCIAMYDDARKAGYLIGPKAEAWGPFRPELFLLRRGVTADVEG